MNGGAGLQPAHMVMRTLLTLLATLTLSVGVPGPGQENPSRQDRRERTPIFVCGEDEKIPIPIPLRWGAVVLAGDSRLFVACEGTRLNPARHPVDHREARENELIVRAGRSSDSEIDWRAAQAEVRIRDGLGGLTPSTVIVPACNAEIQVFGDRRWQPGRLFMLLIDRNPMIRLEAAYGIAAALARPNREEAVIVAATAELGVCHNRPGQPPVSPELKGLILEALGAPRYPTNASRNATEAFLVKEAHGHPKQILGAVKGLESLIRVNSQGVVSDAARVRLRQLTTYGIRTTEAPPLDIDARIRRLAMLALQAARDTDAETLRIAAADGDWQVRRIVAAMLNLSNPEHARLLTPLEADPMFQVRYDLLSPLARLATRTGECAPIVERFKDPSPVVVMRAMDALVATCTDLDEATAKLRDLADKLADRADDAAWRFNSRALAALARVKPDLAKPRIGAAIEHPIWQVRAAAAAASVALRDEGAAVKLAADVEPNVRTAALDALFRMKSTHTVPQAIDALKTGTDYQLIRMAAFVLRGVPEEDRVAANQALLDALQKLTAQETDTSRDPRVAILERLTETFGVDRSNELIPYTIDYDDAVIEAATKAFERIVGVPPAEYPKRRRYLYQPSEEALGQLPRQAEIHLEAGTVTLTLLPDVAPVTVARFAALVAEGFYKDRTFHRVVPNFVVQGGSPAANEYSGTSRYMRDEVGPQAVHVRGAVGISTRGKDTGDGQIFIDLVDLPRLDRDYTVFAYVTQGMELVDRLLEGAKIINITVK